MMVEVLADLPSFEPIPAARGRRHLRPQDPQGGGADRLVAARPPSWSARSRASRPSPAPGSSIDGERIKLLAAERAKGPGEPGEVLDDRLTIACGSGAIRPTLVQRAGKGPMSVEELLRGFAIPEGTILT